MYMAHVLWRGVPVILGPIRFLTTALMTRLAESLLCNSSFRASPEDQASCLYMLVRKNEDSPLATPIG